MKGNGYHVRENSVMWMLFMFQIVVIVAVMGAVPLLNRKIWAASSRACSG